ncbi:MAG: TonB-dependent receptor [Verrucomicrobiota bacterium JB022]|nr:TonB-dependent receptor [Verrucomicrobiota bacterium JB022]
MIRKTLLSLSSLALMLASGSSLWADGTVTGIVRDAQTGLSLEGVQVSANGATTTTDRSGRYYLQLPAGTQTLRFDYLGSETKSQVVDVADARTAQADMSLGLEIFEMDAFVVQGRALGTARALNQQRVSDNLRNVVSADAIGKFPDENAAEALSRLPGVSIERDQGEGRFVIIRGIDPELNSVSIDGVALATPGADERKTLLDTIPTETLASLEVTKAVLPDQPGDSIGGHINLVTPSAFDRDERFITASGAALYSDLTDEFGYKFSAFYSDFLDADRKWGIALSAVASERKFGSDNMESEPWELVEGDDGQEYWAMTDAMEIREYNLSRERHGLSFNLDYRPTDTAQYYLRGSLSEYTDQEIRHAGVLSFGEEWEDENEDEGDITEFTGLGDNGYTAENVGLAREIKDREETMSIYAISAGGLNRIDSLTLDYKAGFSFAKEETPYDFEAKFELLEDANHTDPSDGDFEVYRINPDFAFSNTRGDTLGINFAGPGSDIDPYDANSYEFDEVEAARQDVEEKHYTAEFNARYDFEDSFQSYAKVGGMVRAKNKTSDVSVRVSDDNPGDLDELAGFVESDVRDAYRTRLPLVTESIRDYFRANEGAFAMEDDLEGNVVEDFDADEYVWATYAMGGMTFGQLNVIAGARLEHTDFQTKGFRYDGDSEMVTETEFESDYTNFLPGVHFRYEITPDFIARASWTNAFARPTFAQLSPGIVVDGDEIEQGNPELDPYESMNWDASLEYYFQNLGVVSMAVFHKKVDNFIYGYEFTDDATGNDISTYRNGESGDITGVELGYQQRLTFLPVEGFTFLANATWSESEAEVLERGDMPFVKQSDLVGNVALSYDYGNFFVRVSGTYRDGYLDELGEEALADRYIDSHFQVDISASYTFAHNWTVFADLINVTNEPLRAYWGESGRLAQFEEYGWSAVLGLKWSL